MSVPGRRRGEGVCTTKGSGIVPLVFGTFREAHVSLVEWIKGKMIR